MYLHLQFPDSDVRINKTREVSHEEELQHSMQITILYDYCMCKCIVIDSGSTDNHYASSDTNITIEASLEKELSSDAEMMVCIFYIT